MDRSRQQQLAREFHGLHATGQCLVLVNAWDAGSARLFEHCGAPAIATTSAGMAWALGYADGEKVAVTELLQACERICRVVQRPVSVDIERGFGRGAIEVAGTVRALIERGIVGINIEDGIAPGTSSLAPAELLIERIGAIRSVAQQAGVHLFVNARIDTYFVQTLAGASRYEETLRRARLYTEAGADGIFVPGLANLEQITTLAAAITRPLNIYAGAPGVPRVAELRAAGVRRVSLGCGPLQSALALARDIAAEALHDGTYGSMSEQMLAATEANELFSTADPARG